MKKMRYIFSVLLLVYLLLSATPVGDGFIPLIFGPQLENLKLLILKVHEPEWKIGYRYDVDCKPEDRQNGEALQEAISFSIRRWLEPLKALNPDRPIVDKFVYELQADFISRELEDLEERQAVDLQVTFECTQGISYALTGIIFPPAVFMLRGTEVKGIMLPVLIHEVGHAFGLADTYPHPGIMRNRGGLQSTAGIQPASIMSGHIYDGDKPLDNISEDDKRGIVWLYKYFYEGLDTNTDGCFFADYIFEEEIEGCRPKHPLIFETKHNPPANVLQLLKDDPSIDINAQDVGGMTALHYAVMNEYEEVVITLLAHKDIKPFLSDKQRRTALRIARERGLDKIIALLLSHPLTLAVEATNKLTTTWGQLKSAR